MIGIKLLLLSSFFFFQGIRCYCIHNNLADGSSFKIIQVNYYTEEGAPKGPEFSKHMENNTTECCPHTSKDCSIRLGNNDVAVFSIEPLFVDQISARLFVKCTTGGDLAIHGTKENYYAECTNTEGVTSAATIWDFN